MQVETCHLVSELVNLGSKYLQLLLDIIYVAIFTSFFYFDLLSGDMLHGSSKPFQKDTPTLIADNDEQMLSRVQHLTYKLSSIAACSTKRSRIVRRSTFTCLDGYAKIVSVLDN